MSHPRVFLITALAVVLQSCGSPTAQTDTRALMNLASDAKNARRPADCIAKYTEVLRVRSDIVAAYAGRAGCYTDQGNAAAAVQDYNQAIRLSDRDANLYVLRAEAEEQVGNRTAAEVDFKRVLDISSANPGEMLRAAEGLGRMGFYSDALSVLEFGLGRYPNFWELHKYRADVEIGIGNDPEALREFQAALQLAPGKQIALVLGDRGDFYRLRQDYKLAIADYSRAIAADPGSYLNFEGRALARLASSSDFAGAVSDYSSAINLYASLHSSSTWPLATLYEERGKVYLQQGQRDRAVRDFQLALSIITDSGPLDWQARLKAEIASAS